MADDRSIQKETIKPLVSVIMPCHNASRTIEEAIDSALAQKVRLEVIVIDDASTDGSAQLVQEKYADAPVRLLVNEKNLGAAASRNRGVQAARGKYVAFLDSDDAWAEGKVARQLKLLEKSGACLCCTGRELLTSEGEHTGRIIGVRRRITYRTLLRHNCINCSSVVLPAQIALRYPMEHEDSHEDYITWLKILRDEGEAAGINEPLLLYRLSASGKSGSKLKSARMTFRVYRYMGFGPVRSFLCFASYALHGVVKYLRA